MHRSDDPSSTAQVMDMLRASPCSHAAGGSASNVLNNLTHADLVWIDMGLLRESVIPSNALEAAMANPELFSDETIQRWRAEIEQIDHIRDVIYARKKELQRCE